MPKVLYVTRIYEVRVPEEGDLARGAVEAAIDRAYEHESDADIVKASANAVASFLAHQYDAGVFRGLVHVYDETVDDKQPNIEEFTLTPEGGD